MGWWCILYSLDIAIVDEGGLACNFGTVLYIPVDKILHFKCFLLMSVCPSVQRSSLGTRSRGQFQVSSQSPSFDRQEVHHINVIIIFDTVTRQHCQCYLDNQKLQNNGDCTVELVLLQLDYPRNIWDSWWKLKKWRYGFEAMRGTCQRAYSKPRNSIYRIVDISTTRNS
jgi:hypothetical protein